MGLCKYINNGDNGFYFCLWGLLTYPLTLQVEGRAMFKAFDLVILQPQHAMIRPFSEYVALNDKQDGNFQNIPTCSNPSSGTPHTFF